MFSFALGAISTLPCDFFFPGERARQAKQWKALLRLVFVFEKWRGWKKKERVAPERRADFRGKRARGPPSVHVHEPPTVSPRVFFPLALCVCHWNIWFGLCMLDISRWIGWWKFLVGGKYATWSLQKISRLYRNAEMKAIFNKCKNIVYRFRRYVTDMIEFGLH